MIHIIAREFIPGDYTINNTKNDPNLNQANSPDRETSHY